MLALASGVPVYVQPQIDTVRPADAVLVLGGPGYGRYGAGIELASKGWAPWLVLSNPNGTRDPWLTDFCSRPHRDFRLHCFSPEPATTLGEGRRLRALATEKGWETVIVVTFRPHISRARHILGRCYEGNLVMVADTEPISRGRWVSEYFAQTAGYFRAATRSGC